MPRVGAAPLLLLLLAAPAAGGEYHTRNLGEAADDPMMEEGLHALYNLDYRTTRRNGRKFMRMHPNNPLGPLYMAGILWWEATTEGAGGRANKDTLALFHHSVERTVKMSKRLWKSDDIAQQTDAYFAAGMALGLQGQMRLVDGQYVRAYRSGRKAMKYLKKCVKKDPRYYDAYFGIGVFDYQVAMLSGAIKIGARMLLRGTGNAQRGLKRIQLSIRKGSFSSRQASGFLLTLYILSEKDYPRALALTEDLLLNFPESPYFNFIRVQLLHRTGRGIDSYRLAKNLFEHMRANPASFQRKQLSTICGLYGADCMTKANLSEAVRWLTTAGVAAEAEEATPEWTAYLYFYRGITKDILGRRNSAKVDYGRAGDLPDFMGTRNWARFCRVRPCGRKDAVRFMRGGPISH